MSKVFLALQKTNETHGLVEAILADNPHAEYEDHPGMIKINAEKSMAVKRETVEEQLGRKFDLQELHVYLITLTGHIDETDDELTLSWND